MRPPLLDFCSSRLGQLRADIETLVRLESPSTDKAAVDRCGDALTTLLASAGASVKRVSQSACGDHILAEFAGGPAGVLILGHFDTVWDVGQIERMPFVEKDGRLYGPGIFDMKSSIAVALLAMRALIELGMRAPRVTMLWTTDEEVGSLTSRALIEEQAAQHDAVLVVEPSLPGGSVKTRRKGCGEFTLTVHGVSAHAGIDPGNGASAIHELARQIVALQALTDLDRGVSVNVGKVAGGTRGNVIAERATAAIDVRVPAMTDAVRIEALIRGLRATDLATRLEVEGGFDRPPLERTDGVVRLYHEARQVAERLGRTLGEGGTGGGSDGNFTAALGVPTLDGLGPQGDGAHAVHEHVLVADLPWRAAFLAALIERLNTVKLASR